MTDMTNFFSKDTSAYLRDLNAVLSAKGLAELPCVLVADDDGYNQNNLAFWVVKDGALTIGEHKIMSRGKRGRQLQTFGGAGVGIYSSGDDEYTISPNLTDPEDTRTDQYAKTPLNRFLVHAALNSIGLTDGIPAAVITGLPIAQHMKADGTNDKLIAAKTANLQTAVTVGPNKKPSAHIVCHRVLPEAICGIVDWIMNDSGEMIKDPNVTRMALDIGGNTTDMAIIVPGNEVLEMKTVKFGVSHIRDELKSLLEDKFEMALDSIVMDEALATKVAIIFGEEHDVSEAWNQAVSKILKDIYHSAESLRQKYPSLREMVGFGGGIALCQEVIKEKFPSILTVEKPDGANARGALKFTTFGALNDLVVDINNTLSEAKEA